MIVFTVYNTIGRVYDRREVRFIKYINIILLKNKCYQNVDNFKPFLYQAVSHKWKKNSQSIKITFLYFHALGSIRDIF